MEMDEASWKVLLPQADPLGESNFREHPNVKIKNIMVTDRRMAIY
jgi:hypothetical protein